VAKSLAKNPKDRYQTGRELAYDLRVALRRLTKTDRMDDKIHDAIDFVHHVPFFNNFTREQVKSLSEASTIVKVARKKMIVIEGEIDDTFFIILSGKAKIVKETRTIAVVGAGECFGEMAYICGQPRSASVVADTDCILMKISATLMDRSPDEVQLLFFRNFAMTLVRRLASRPVS
jgi:serine/threonine-protein kinase